MMHVGAGWAMARLRRRLDRVLTRFDPLMRWLVLDGYGFHEGYFRWPRSVERQWVPAGLSGYAAAGLRPGTGPEPLVRRGGRRRLGSRRRSPGSPATRQADLWSGVGLACAYAGGVTDGRSEAEADGRGRTTPRWLRARPSPPRPRQRAGNLGAPDGAGLPGYLRPAGRGGGRRDGRRPGGPSRRRPASRPIEVWRPAHPGPLDARRPCVMTELGRLLRRHAARLAALAIILALYGLARQPELSGDRAARLAARFQFVVSTSPGCPATSSPRPSARSIRASRRIASWISSVGAAVALNDLDGDGLPNDVCLRGHADRPGDRRAGPRHAHALRAVRPRLRRPSLRPGHDGPHGLPARRLERGRPDGRAGLLLGPAADRVPPPRRAARRRGSSAEPRRPRGRRAEAAAGTPTPPPRPTSTATATST